MFGVLADTGLITQYDLMRDLLVELFPSEWEVSKFYLWNAFLKGDTTTFDIPAKISPEVLAEMHRIAQKAWTLLNCYGMGRIDFLVTPDRVVLNEINTIPGFTSISMYPDLLNRSGIDGPTLMKRLVELALERKQHQPRNLQFFTSHDWYKGQSDD